MATKINVRSPFYIKPSNSSLVSATMQLYIYTGVLTTDKPASAQYTITKNEIDNNNYVVFEISELVRDYLDIEFDGEYDSQTVWVESDITMYDAADGGGSTVGSPINNKLYSVRWLWLLSRGYKSSVIKRFAIIK